MSCSQCDGIEWMFDRSSAEKQLKDYQRKGAPWTTRTLIEAISAGGVQGLTLLDIGGGIGAIQLELLQRGASQAVSVDASQGYLSVAQEEAAREGISERIRFQHGNFIDLAPETEQADLVTLDRVICCFPDMEGLVSASAGRASRRYGLVYPRDLWWVRLALGIMNLFLRLRGSDFRIFAHRTVDVEDILSQLGFPRRFNRHNLFWQVAVYAKS